MILIWLMIVSLCIFKCWLASPFILKSSFHHRCWSWAAPTWRTCWWEENIVNKNNPRVHLVDLSYPFETSIFLVFDVIFINSCEEILLIAGVSSVYSFQTKDASMRNIWNQWLFQQQRQLKHIILIILKQN